MKAAESPQSPTMSPTSSPQKRVQPKIVEDDKKEQRQELRKKASTLQKYVHFEASMKPHLSKLTKDIDDLVKQCDEIEGKITALKKNIEKEQQIQKNSNSAFSEENKNARESKIQEIQGLESDLQRLLKEKEKYLAKAENQLPLEQ